MTAAAAAGLAAANIAALFESVFGELDTLSSRISSTLIETRGSRSHFVEADLKKVKPITLAFLAKHEFVAAAGVILSPGTIDPSRGTIEWWRHSDSGTNSKVVFNLTPETGSFYDMETLSWFYNTVQAGTRAITGPYVDYGGLDQYIMTLTFPLDLGTNVTGMVGCDIEVGSIEAIIVPMLRRIPADAALLNADGRVILGNSGQFLVGTRVRTTPPDGAIILVDAPALRLSLVYAKHASYN